MTRAPADVVDHMEDIAPPAALGAFLRSRRARLAPEDAGLPAYGRHRRVPGLHREELALLAGVSVAYLTRLEQDRGGNVSAEVLDALARALRLSPAERRHLRDLADCPPGKAPVPPHRESLRASMRSMLAAIDSTPAYVTGHRLDILGWNAPAAAVFGDWGALPPHERNMARLVFLDRGLRDLHTDWHAKATDTAGALRQYAGCHPDDPHLATLVSELSSGSEDFRRLWATYELKERSHGARLLRHPLAGELPLSFESFRLPDDPEQCLTVYHAPPGSAAAENLRLLISREGAAATR
ncbi:helix-turn-helix transcriptional regulator [Spirillospora sp. NPDC029432]|uniref:helix-turn-helix transcriptional regulator n=1 Tax=Spirillospora sp. NPDC029432 TaxID=3154599 RepID=UPI0034563255